MSPFSNKKSFKVICSKRPTSFFFLDVGLNKITLFLISNVIVNSLEYLSINILRQSTVKVAFLNLLIF